MILGYAQSEIVQSGITSIVDASGLEMTIDVAEGQAVKLSAYFPSVASTVGTDRADAFLWEGDTQLQAAASPAPSVGTPLSPWVVLFPSLGLHTYRARLARGSGSGVLTSYNAPIYPAFLIAEGVE